MLLFRFLCLGTLFLLSIESHAQRHGLPTLPTENTPKKNSADYLNEAVDFYRDGLYNKSLTLLHKAIQDNKLEHLRDDLFFSRGIVYLQLEQYDSAKVDLDTAILENPSTEYIFRRSQVFMAMQNYEQALTDVDTVLARNATNGEALFRKAYILQQKGLLKQAIDAYTQTITHAPNIGEAYYHRGTLLFRFLDPEQACEDYHKAAELGVPQAKKGLLKYCKDK